MRTYSVLLIMLFGLTGCMSIVKMENLKHRKVLYESKLDSTAYQRSLILIVPSNSELDTTNENSITKILDGKLAEIVANTGAHVIDRKLQTKLLTEIRRCELEGRPLNNKCFKSKVPNYVISAKVTSVELSSSFTKASSYKDKKGKTTHTPSSCSYKVKFDSLVSIYNMNQLSLKEVVAIKGDNSASINSRNSNCPFTKNITNNGITASVKDAAEYYGSDIKSVFSPKANILEYRWGHKESDNYFRLSIGKAEGATTGLEVIVLRNDGKTSEGEPDFSREIARGIIIETNSQYREAWIAVKSREDAARILPGDFIKIVYAEKACKNTFYKKLCNLF